MKTLTGLAFAALIAIASPALADPSGQYTMKGTNPGGEGNYRGSVVVKKVGDVYEVVWTIGGDRVTGTAIGNDEFLAVGYTSGTKPGIAAYSRKADGTWEGVWTYLGNSRIGTETWSLR